MRLMITGKITTHRWEVLQNSKPVFEEIALKGLVLGMVGVEHCSEETGYLF